MLTLLSHQRRGVDALNKRKKYALFWEPGTCKTLTTLTHIAEEKAAGWKGKTLVLCPASIMNTAWLADSKHCPTLKAVVCWASTPAARRRLIATPDADVLILNYESAKKHFDDFIAAGVTRLVIDECQKLKVFNTQISVACHEFSDKMEGVVLLSGTPDSNGTHEFWSQIRCIAPRLFGTNFYRHAHTFFAPVKRPVQGVSRIVGWKPIEAKREEFLAKLQSVSWSLRKVDCLDLPPQTDVIREVDLSPAEKAAYVSMFNELRLEVAGQESITAPIQARLMKLRQITGGIVYGPTGAVNIGSSKLDECVEVLEEIGDRQSVIWCEFTSEIERLVVELRRKGRRVGRLDGKVPLDYRVKYIQDFQAGKLDNVVCHPAAAGHGVTLTGAAYAIYFSHSFSFEQYQQSRDRIHRVGQKSNTTYFHLIAPRSVDAAIWRALQGKRSVHDSVMELLSGGGEFKETP